MIFIIIILIIIFFVNLDEKEKFETNQNINKNYKNISNVNDNFFERFFYNLKLEYYIDYKKIAIWSYKS